jgi:3-isopropylmalate dehydratase small subunit
MEFEGVENISFSTPSKLDQVYGVIQVISASFRRFFYKNITRLMTF